MGGIILPFPFYHSAVAAAAPLRNCKSKVLGWRAPPAAAFRLAATGDGGLRSNGLPGKAGQTLGSRRSYLTGGEGAAAPSLRDCGGSEDAQVQT